MKYNIEITSLFKKEYKKMKRRNKDMSKLQTVINSLANGEVLDKKYKDHALNNDKRYIDCRECHIEPNWLLVYKYHDKKLLLLLVETGTHSDLFNCVF